MDGTGLQGAMELVMRPWVATHQETQERLSAHLDGELVGREAKRVLRHLARCDRCREMLRSLARAVDTLRTLGLGDVPSPSVSVADAVVDRIRGEG